MKPEQRDYELSIKANFDEIVRIKFSSDDKSVMKATEDFLTTIRRREEKLNESTGD